MLWDSHGPSLTGVVPGQVNAVEPYWLKYGAAVWLILERQKPGITTPFVANLVIPAGTSIPASSHASLTFTEVELHKARLRELFTKLKPSLVRVCAGSSCGACVSLRHQLTCRGV